MSLFYQFAYLIGLKPWEEMSKLTISGQIHAMLDRESKDRQQPFGHALDLGCGSGIWTVELARRGWEVTGIDIVPKALRAAQHRLHDAGMKARMIRGSITALRAAEVGNGFKFVLDFGVIHGLNAAQRADVGREVTAVTSPNATMLMLAWEPGRRGPLPRGINPNDIRSSFPGWDIVDDQVANVPDAPRFIRKARPHFYRLRRKEQ